MVVELDTSVTNEFTLAMIKPDAVASGSARDILHAIETNGFHIIGKKCIQVRTTPTPTLFLFSFHLLAQTFTVLFAVLSK